MTAGGRGDPAPFAAAFGAAGTPALAATFTAQALEGERPFRASGCASCHATVAQVSDSVHDVGRDGATPIFASGTQRPAMRGTIVVP